MTGTYDSGDLITAGKMVRIIVMIVLGLAAVAGVGYGAYLKLTEADRDANGNLTSQGKIDVTDLKVGDCVVDNLAEGQFTRVKVAPCTQSHFFETFATFTLPKTDFPGDEQVEKLSGKGCLKKFAGFVGISFDDSKIDMTHMAPVESTWDINRGVACILTEGVETTGSLKGAKR